MSQSRCRRILYVAPSCSVHTRKWCDWFCTQGYEIHVATFDQDEINGAIMHRMGTAARPDSNDGAKLAYLAAIHELKRIESMPISFTYTMLQAMEQLPRLH